MTDYRKYPVGTACPRSGRVVVCCPVCGKAGVGLGHRVVHAGTVVGGAVVAARGGWCRLVPEPNGRREGKG